MFVELFCFLIFTIEKLLLISCESIQEESCYIKNYDTNEYWKLIWQDEFDEDRLDQEWDIAEHKCTVSPQIGCSLQRNIHIIDGNLVLAAKAESYLAYNYAVSELLSRSFHTYGRWEFRAALPIGQYVQVLFQARNDSQPYWHESGNMSIVKEYQKDMIRLYFFAKSESPHDNVNDTLRAVQDFHSFHRYGLEWTQSGVRFFFDNLYGREMKFEKSQMSKWNQIGFVIKFGLKISKTNSRDIEWKCPALIVDYVRVYAQMDNPKLSTQSSNLHKCVEKPRKSEQFKIDQICHFVQFGKNKWTQAIEKHWLPFTIVLLFLVLFGLVVYSRMQNKEIEKVHQELEMYGPNYSKRKHRYEQIEYVDHPNKSNNVMESKL